VGKRTVLGMAREEGLRRWGPFRPKELLGEGKKNANRRNERLSRYKRRVESPSSWLIIKREKASLGTISSNKKRQEGEKSELKSGMVRILLGLGNSIKRTRLVLKETRTKNILTVKTRRVWEKCLALS